MSYRNWLMMACVVALAWSSLAGCGSTAPVGAAESAAVALDWNEVALQCVASVSQMPPQASRSLAMLHGAMYDAVNSIERRGAAYRVNVPVTRRASSVAAAAAAAHRVLTQLYPSQVALCDLTLTESLAAIPDGPFGSQDDKDAGSAVGVAAADAILAWRTGDGSAGMSPPVTGGLAPGEWRPTPPSYSPGVFGSWSLVTPFALATADQFRPGPPPTLDSAAYAAAWEETRVVGSVASATRTTEQATWATFWVGMPGSVTEVGRMNQVVQQAASLHGLTLHQAARLFALVNLAMADAAIAGLDCKYHYLAWRPVTAIWEAAGDGNADTAADPTWLPFLVTPAHPEYPSTHSALTRAAATVLAGVLGSDDAPLMLPAFMGPGMSRSYSSFSQVADEAGLGRIYGGIHFRFSYDAGNQLGQAIGAYVLGTQLLPL